MSIEGDIYRHCQTEKDEHMSEEQRDRAEWLFRNIWLHIDSLEIDYVDSICSCSDEELRQFCSDVCDSVEGYKNG